MGSIDQVTGFHYQVIRVKRKQGYVSSHIMILQFWFFKECNSPHMVRVGCHANQSDILCNCITAS